MISPSGPQLRRAALLALLVLAGLLFYCKLAEFFDLCASEVYGRSGWVWLVAGPFAFFAFVAIGSVFAWIGAGRRAGPLKHVSKIAVSISAASLAIGVLVTAYLEWVTNALRLTPRERAEDLLTIIAPMVIGAWLLFCALRDMRGDRAQASGDDGHSLDSRPGLRRPIRTFLGWVGALTTAGGIVLAVLASSILLLLSGCEPPSVQSLARQFPLRQKTLEQIVSMSDQDSQLAVIDPTWLELPNGAPTYSAATAGISQSRWEEYRRIFRSAGIDQGIRRYGGPKGDAFIIVRSIGILDNGYSTGYLLCAPGTEHNWAQVCNSSETHGVYPYSRGADEGYEFIKLTDRWYAYKEGPG